jgi:hypothetical protein
MSKSNVAVCGAQRMRPEIKFTVPITLGVILVSFLISGSSAQQREQPIPAQTTIRVQSSLVLVDVISQDPKNGLPVRDFKKEDFRMYDNGQELKFPVSLTLLCILCFRWRWRSFGRLFESCPD